MEQGEKGYENGSGNTKKVKEKEKKIKETETNTKATNVTAPSEIT